MAEQTAVKWLVEQLKSRFDIDIERLSVTDQAKAMEKEQMHKCASFWRGKENEIEKPIFDIYYNETFKNK